MDAASDILDRLDEIDCEVVQPVITNSGVRFTVYRMTDLESIKEWVQVAEKCKAELGANIDTSGVHSEANFRIWIPEENIDFDVEEGGSSISTGYN